MTGLFDVLIAGGGPAGLTAALYVQRAGKQAAVAERAETGGQIIYSPQVDNYPGLPEISGADFAARLTEQAEAAGAKLFYREVTGLRKTEDGFRMDTEEGPLYGRAVVLACGARHRRLGLAEEEDLAGAGVSYCAVCDGAFYSGREVAVVGGGDTALQDALFLSGICSKVTVLVRRDRFRGAPAKAELLRRRHNVEIRFCRAPEALVCREGALAGLQLRNTAGGPAELLPAEGLFIAVGQEPDTAPFAPLVALDGGGFILAGEDTSTSCPGIFAAGDCRQKRLRQLATAVSDGACAASAACGWLDGLE